MRLRLYSLSTNYNAGQYDLHGLLSDVLILSMCRTYVKCCLVKLFVIGLRVFFKHNNNSKNKETHVRSASMHQVFPYKRLNYFMFII